MSRRFEVLAIVTLLAVTSGSVFLYTRRGPTADTTSTYGGIPTCFNALSPTTWTNTVTNAANEASESVGAGSHTVSYTKYSDSTKSTVVNQFTDTLTASPAEAHPGDTISVAFTSTSSTNSADSPSGITGPSSLTATGPAATSAGSATRSFTVPADYGQSYPDGKLTFVVIGTSNVSDFYVEVAVTDPTTPTLEVNADPIFIGSGTSADVSASTSGLATTLTARLLGSNGKVSHTSRDTYPWYLTSDQYKSYSTKLDSYRRSDAELPADFSLLDGDGPWWSYASSNSFDSTTYYRKTSWNYDGTGGTLSLADLSPGAVPIRFTAQRTCASTASTEDVSPLAYALKLFTDDPVLSSTADTSSELAIGIDGYDQLGSDEDRTTVKEYFAGKQWTLQLVGRNSDSEGYTPIDGIQFSDEDAGGWDQIAATSTENDFTGTLDVDPSQWTNEAASQKIYVRATNGISYDDVQLKLTIQGTQASGEFPVFVVGYQDVFEGNAEDSGSVTPPAEIEELPSDDTDESRTTSTSWAPPKRAYPRLARLFTPVKADDTGTRQDVTLTEVTGKGRSADVYRLFNDVRGVYNLIWKTSKQSEAVTYRATLKLDGADFYDATPVKGTGDLMTNDTIVWEKTLEPGKTKLNFPLVFEFPSAKMGNTSDGKLSLPLTVEKYRADGSHATELETMFDVQLIPVGKTEVSLTSVAAVMKGTEFPQEELRILPGDIATYTVRYEHPPNAPKIPDGKIYLYGRISAYGSPTSDTYLGFDEDRHAYYGVFPLADFIPGDVKEYTYRVQYDDSIDADVVNVGTQLIWLDTEGPQKKVEELRKDSLHFMLQGTVRTTRDRPLPNARIRVYEYDPDNPSVSLELASERTESLFTDDDGAYDILVDRSELESDELYETVTLYSDSDSDVDQLLQALIEIGGTTERVKFTRDTHGIPEAARYNPDLVLSPGSESVLADPAPDDFSEWAQAMYYAAEQYRDTQRYLQWVKDDFGYDYTAVPLKIVVNNSEADPATYYDSGSSSDRAKVSIGRWGWDGWLSAETATHVDISGQGFIDDYYTPWALFHELGHHVHLKTLENTSWPGADWLRRLFAGTTLGANHNGFVNDSSRDSLVEGVADFFSYIAYVALSDELDYAEFAHVGTKAERTKNGISLVSLNSAASGQVWSNVLLALKDPANNRVGKEDEESTALSHFLWSLVDTGHSYWSGLSWINLPSVTGAELVFTDSISLPTKYVTSAILDGSLPPQRVGDLLSKIAGNQPQLLDGAHQQKNSAGLDGWQQLEVVFGFFRDSSGNFKYDKNEIIGRGPSNSLGFMGNKWNGSGYTLTSIPSRPSRNYSTGPSTTPIVIQPSDRTKIGDVTVTRVDRDGKETTLPVLDPRQWSADRYEVTFYPDEQAQYYVVSGSKASTGVVIDAGRYALARAESVPIISAPLEAGQEGAPVTVAKLVSDYQQRQSAPTDTLPQPTASVAQSTVRAGSNVTIQVQNFAKGETISVAIDSQPTDQTFPIVSENFTINVQVPMKTKLGDHTITLTSNAGPSVAVPVLVKGAERSVTTIVTWVVVGLAGLLVLRAFLRRRRDDTTLPT